MYKTVADAVDTALAIKRLVANANHCDVVIAPVFTALKTVVDRLEGSNIRVAAQNCSTEVEEGAHTGEVAAFMLREVGVSYVIVGHSERRQSYFETDTMVRRKVLAAQHEEVHARWQADLKKRWDERPIAPPRLAYEIWEALKKEDWLLVAGAFRGWPSRLWTWDKPGLFLGGYGGGGLGYGPAASVGASLPYRGTGKVCVNLQRDGEMLYTTSALWTAANTGVPLLTVMTNNRVYYNDVEHQEKVAIHRGSSDGPIVTVVSAGDDGHFSVALPPGSYSAVLIGPLPPGAMYGGWDRVTVEPHTYSDVTLRFSNGVQ